MPNYYTNRGDKIYNPSAYAKTGAPMYKTKYSESNRAKQLAQSCNLSNEVGILKNTEIPEYLNKILEVEYEPFSSLRVLSQHHLYETFKDKAKVIFDGSGGDEIGGGYSYYVSAWYLDLLKENNLNNLHSRFFKLINEVKNYSVTNEQFLLGSLTNLFRPGLATVDGSIYKKDNILNKDFTRDFEKDSFNIKKPFISYMRNAQYADLFYLKLPRCLRYIDRASMRNSIEARVPFLDHKVVEACFSVPSKYKILNNMQRIITKYPFKNIIDKQKLFQNKMTIADPQSFWLRNSLKELVNDTFNSNNFSCTQIFNKNFVKQYYFDYCKEREKHVNSFFLLQILLTELWFNNILKNN